MSLSLVGLYYYAHRTPLHCAVAYLNLSAIQLLIRNGASLFLTTSDRQTPLGILQEDVEGLAELIDDTTRQCYIFLNRKWTKDSRMFCLKNVTAMHKIFLLLCSGILGLKQASIAQLLAWYQHVSIAGK